jgi:hypothetical protein
MKKLLTFSALICVFAILMTACTQGESENKLTESLSESESATAQSDNSNGGAPSAQETKQDKDTSYWDLKGRQIKKHKDVYFSFDKSKSIALSLSEDWTLQKSEDGASYGIAYEGSTIGTILKGVSQDSEWTAVSNNKRTVDTSFSVKKFIEKRDGQSGTEYRYRFEYSYNMGESTEIISLCINYLALDLNAADRLYKSSKVYTASNVKDGMLSKGKGGEVAILGNSFISSSSIGYILEDMMATSNESGSFNAVSRGYATVQTYASDSTVISDIKNGRYKIVFMCGFYSNAEITQLQKIYDACKVSGTELVIFPAHNESESVVNSARKSFPDVTCLNWKGELDLLIESGVDKWKLCVNDQHLHSTPLAGLVGAHMIYRAIYGEFPILDGVMNADVAEAKSLFGDYLETGVIKFDYEVNTFN